MIRHSASTVKRSSHPPGRAPFWVFPGGDCFCLQYLLSDESWRIELTQKNNGDGLLRSILCPGGVFSKEEARLLSRSRCNDHVVNASVENWILDKQSSSCVTGIATMVNKPSSFERGTFILLGDVKFIALQRFWGEILDTMSKSISDKWLAW
jgi:hypothetical protein